MPNADPNSDIYPIYLSMPIIGNWVRLQIGQIHLSIKAQFGHHSIRVNTEILIGIDLTYINVNGLRQTAEPE